MFSFFKKISFRIALVSTMGGMLCGYMTAIMAGVLPIVRDEWALSSAQQEWIMAIALLGAVGGAFASNRLSVPWGHKNLLLLAAFLYITGILCCIFSHDIISLILSRAITGTAIGLSSYTLPQYGGEIAPVRNQSIFIGLHQLMITIGILISYLTALLLVSYSHHWHWMFLTGLIPAFLLAAGVMMLPKTPKYLIQKGRFLQARSVLAKIESPEKVEMIMDILRHQAESEKHYQSRWRDIFSSGILKILLVSIALMFVQQACGINIFIYYAPVLYEIAGFQSLEPELAASVILGTVNVIFTIIALNLVEQMSRKTLYVIGLALMTLFLFALGIIFMNYVKAGPALKWMVFASSLGFVMFFAVSIGPLSWLMASEILPLNIRNVGMGLSLTCNWIFNFLVVFTFYKISKVFSLPGNEFIIQQGNKGIIDIFFNPSINFFLYGLICLGALVWGYFFLPETKGMSYFEIEDYWNKKFGRKSQKTFIYT